MIMEVSVGMVNHRSCVLLLDMEPSTIEMTQMDDMVAVECSGQSYLLMQNHGLKVSRYVIAGMQMMMEVSAEEELQSLYALLLESSLKNTQMIQMVDLGVAECHGSCLFLVFPQSG